MAPRARGVGTGRAIARSGAHLAPREHLLGAGLIAAVEADERLIDVVGRRRLQHAESPARRHRRAVGVEVQERLLAGLLHAIVARQVGNVFSHVGPSSATHLNQGRPQRARAPAAGCCGEQRRTCRLTMLKRRSRSPCDSAYSLQTADAAAISDALSWSSGCATARAGQHVAATATSRGARRGCIPIQNGRREPTWRLHDARLCPCGAAEERKRARQSAPPRAPLCCAQQGVLQRRC